MDLIARRVIKKIEGTDSVSVLEPYTHYTTDKYSQMIDMIREELGFTSLRYQSLEGMLEAIGIDPENVCTYCWNGKE